MTTDRPTLPAKFLEARCLGCREPLEPARKAVRYCGKRCRSVVRTIEPANELGTAARAAHVERGWSPEVRAMFEEADAQVRRPRPPDVLPVERREQRHRPPNLRDVPVQETDCLEHALKNVESFGFWEARPSAPAA